MEPIVFASIMGAVAAVFGAYHTAVVVPRDKETNGIKDRLRAVESDNVRLQTEVTVLQGLPKQIGALVEAINELKVQIAHIQK